jgi:hypothetical protein
MIFVYCNHQRQRDFFYHPVYCVAACRWEAHAATHSIITCDTTTGISRSPTKETAVILIIPTQICEKYDSVLLDLFFI